MKRASLLIAVILISVPSPAFCEEKPYVAADLRDNVQVRLVAARLRNSKVRFIVAKFETLDDEPRTVSIRLRSRDLTAHEQTLIAVVKACVDLSGAKATDGRNEEWHQAKAKAIFAIPKIDSIPNVDEQRHGMRELLAECYLVSLTAKKGE